ncbi:hypothetical protein PGB28_14490 [Primorskyibacter aestuariivivens]|uniref:hypothetical protein n=1 Tax=Primorskyibacter aestuariivivens TaxID=1888912 RepID=UPI0023011E14|nr:hypothetical protein [Primorskyibacter aestuariivivens]MDA7429673.1 hypothetical protein [Primorskyibacter aestuariivivens]
MDRFPRRVPLSCATGTKPVSAAACTRSFRSGEAMLRDAWDMRFAITHNEKDELQKQLKAAEQQIKNLLDRVVDATSASVVRAYEARIEKLERQKLVPIKRVEKNRAADGTAAGL